MPARRCITIRWARRFRNRLAVCYTQADTDNVDHSSGFASSTLTTNLGQRIKIDYQGQIDLIKGETLVGGAETQTDRLRTTTPW